MSQSMPVCWRVNNVHGHEIASWRCLVKWYLLGDSMNFACKVDKSRGVEVLFAKLDECHSAEDGVFNGLEEGS